VYMAWRNYNSIFTLGGPSSTLNVAATCSFNGGNSWRTIDQTSFPATADFPRMSVAPDGSVFVAFETDGGSGAYSLFVHKFSPCEAGFQPQAGFPAPVAQNIGELPSIAGLDRQPNGGDFIVSPDDSDLSGQHLFLVFARNSTEAIENALGSTDVVLSESFNGGLNWTVASQPVNSTSTGYRYFPWACSANGRTYVTWYDRRDATDQKPDLTSYVWASATDPTHSGTPTITVNTSVSGSSSNDDPTCESGFLADQVLAAPTDIFDETFCNNDLPTATVGAGICTTCTSQEIETAEEQGTLSTSCGSLTPCDFRSSNPCANTSENCSQEDGGPKYGDYNGAACARGLLFLAWASATRPRSVTCAQAGGTCSTASDCCGGSLCSGGICVPSGRAGCSGNGSSCTTLDACCSSNCLAGVCQPGINVYTYATSCTSCPGETGCVDIANSNSDCGGCGQKCGGVCSAGVCEPIVMFRSAPTNQSTEGIASDGTNVYFTTQGVVSAPAQVLSVPAASPVGAVFATPSIIPISTPGVITSFSDIVLDSASPYVFFTDLNADVYASPKLGGSVSPVNDAISNTAVDVAISGTNGFVLTFGGVVLQPLPSGTTSVLAPTIDPESITADPTNVYWSDRGTTTTTNVNTGTVTSIPVGGGTPTTLATGQAAPMGIGVDANNVYWVDEYLPPSVMKVPIGGGTVTTLVALNDPPAAGLGPVCCAGVSNVVSDGTSVYYSTPNFAAHTGGQVWRVPVGGGTPVLLVNDANGPALRMALDANNLYWTDGSTVDKIALH
jgi:hypothetical protein